MDSVWLACPKVRISIRARGTLGLYSAISFWPDLPVDEIHLRIAEDAVFTLREGEKR